MSNTTTTKPDTANDNRPAVLSRYTFTEQTVTVNACTVEATSEDEAWDLAMAQDWFTISVDGDDSQLDSVEDI